ncbi:MAG TPA: protein translocase subunit SecF [Firmicutes bacterium]|nr:protein translocase subunit SecF [Bacillota bacterium]
MNLIKYRKLFLAIFIVAVIFSVTAWCTKGLNYGVDFTGGTNIRFPLSQEVTSTEVNEVLASDSLAKLNLKPTPPQPYSYVDSQGHQRYGVLVHTRFLNKEEQKMVVDALEEAFGWVSAGDGLDIYSVDPLIGEELLGNALKALIIAGLLILVYIAFRFEFKSGIVGLLALIHDVLAVIGLFAIMHKEVDATFIAAILTILGYSINDTIVIFDRIRENLRFRKKGQTYDDLVNLSILQTMRRSLNTSVTTALAILVLYLVGSPSIKNFCLAMLVGITVGAYSSIFVTGPLWALWKGLEEKKRYSGKTA